ncbi:MAG TPA: 1-deoxy-D-xylulose-5-phosphate synthase [Oligoflexia bacterium]|nr:1-deoxy-D-xylulose-5-phosphate synthase [Oligoflexia bacterium]HMR24579.1 1-deoxy-D-xylulose-5-phosphate synthase [Oligoflexia bacterium]
MDLIDQKEYKAGPLLNRVDNPKQLRESVSVKQLPQLCQELRQYIIDIVSEQGGHLGASLGVIEMTVALHYAYNTPHDQLVWDVGHQAYAHKILTERRDVFPSNRKYGGISGFPKRSESEYDTFGVGHSSTSISAALGMAVASKLTPEDNRKCIAVIGDGAMNAGLSFEALNHGGVEEADILVVLNDNCMSIDPNVGALKEYLSHITASHTYNRIKDEVWSLLGKISNFGPDPRAVVQRLTDILKNSVLKESNFFESLKWRYFGPIDGHNVEQMVRMFKDLKDIPGPKLLHCITTKGKGYQPAEDGSATVWHAPGLFDKNNGKIIKSVKSEPQPPKFQDVFGHTLVELAKNNKKIAGVTPAMPTGCSLKFMMEEIPERSFDVGIAEQHAVTFSAGLATQGMIPFCNIYSSFMQRAYDQVIHDVALQDLQVIFCLDRGGLVGADGATHHGAYDIAYMRCIPNMIVACPMDEIELRNMMFTAQEENHGPFSIRYPRGQGFIADWQKPFSSLKIGQGRQLTQGSDLAILSVGAIGTEAVQAVKDLQHKGISVAHYDMRFVKPIDQELLHTVFKNHDKVLTLEDGCLQGGFGSAVLEFMADHDYQAKVVRLGIPDRYIQHGTQPELYKECGYDADAIVQACLELSQIKNNKEPKTSVVSKKQLLMSEAI